MSSSEQCLIVDYESQEVKDDSNDQLHWNKLIGEGPLGNPTSYQKATVLLLRWASDTNDKRSNEEIQRLRVTFEQRFHYETFTQYLDTTEPGRLQVKVNAIVSAFVLDHDGPQHLLIVYYTGHGKPGSSYGTLELVNELVARNVCGTATHKGSESIQNYSLNEVGENPEQLIWNKTEVLLRPARADILEIFDCCYAGNLGLTRGHERSFEYLAACGVEGKTRVPGKGSFTSALIEAMIRLLRDKPEGRFTTIDLLNGIKPYSREFPKDQHPELFERGGQGPAGRIILHPIRSKDSKTLPPPMPDPSQNLAKQKVLTLYFDMVERPSKEQVAVLCRGLNKIFERDLLGVKTVRWGGIRGFADSSYSQAAKMQLQERARLLRELENYQKEQKQRLLADPSKLYTTADAQKLIDFASRWADDWNKQHPRGKR